MALCAKNKGKKRKYHYETVIKKQANSTFKNLGVCIFTSQMHLYKKTISFSQTHWNNNLNLLEIRQILTPSNLTNISFHFANMLKILPCSWPSALLLQGPKNEKRQYFPGYCRHWQQAHQFLKWGLIVSTTLSILGYGSNSSFDHWI